MSSARTVFVGVKPFIFSVVCFFWSLVLYREVGYRVFLYFNIWGRIKSWVGIFILFISVYVRYYFVRVIIFVYLLLSY